MGNIENDAPFSPVLVVNNPNPVCDHKYYGALIEEILRVSVIIQDLPMSVHSALCWLWTTLILWLDTKTMVFSNR